jgi:hypothetical protein
MTNEDRRTEGTDDDKSNRGRTDKIFPDEVSNVPNSPIPKNRAEHDGNLVWSEDVKADKGRMVRKTDDENTSRKTEIHMDEDDATVTDRAQNPTRRKNLKMSGETQRPRGRPRSIPRAAQKTPYDYSGIQFP